MTQTLQYRTARVLDEAATRIETYGWCRGTFRNGERRCTLGALLLTDAEAYDNAVRAVEAEILRSGFPRPAGATSLVPAWNDAQRDRRKVVRLLRRAARRVRRSPTA